MHLFIIMILPDASMKNYVQNLKSIWNQVLQIAQAAEWFAFWSGSTNHLE